MVPINCRPTNLLFTISIFLATQSVCSAPIGVDEEANDRWELFLTAPAALSPEAPPTTLTGSPSSPRQFVTPSPPATTLAPSQYRPMWDYYTCENLMTYTRTRGVYIGTVRVQYEKVFPLLQETPIFLKEKGFGDIACCWEEAVRLGRDFFHPRYMMDDEVLRCCVTRAKQYFLEPGQKCPNKYSELPTVLSFPYQGSRAGWIIPPSWKGFYTPPRNEQISTASFEEVSYDVGKYWGYRAEEPGPAEPPPQSSPKPQTPSPIPAPTPSDSSSKVPTSSKFTSEPPRKVTEAPTSLRHNGTDEGTDVPTEDLESTEQPSDGLPQDDPKEKVDPTIGTTTEETPSSPSSAARDPTILPLFSTLAAVVVSLAGRLI